MLTVLRQRWKRPRAMRIGVLLNHDQTHQAGHCVPVAAALHRRGIDVTVVTTSWALSAETAWLAALLGAPDIPIVELQLRRPRSRIAAALLDRVLPAAKLAIYGDNVDIL